MVYAGRRRLEMSGDPADGRHQAALDIFTMAFSNEIPQLNKVIPVLQKNIARSKRLLEKKKNRGPLHSSRGGDVLSLNSG
jgi:hypothetical protein